MVDFTKQTNQTNNKISVVHTQKKKKHKTNIWKLIELTNQQQKQEMKRK